MELQTRQCEDLISSGWDVSTAAHNYGVSDWGHDLFEVSHDGEMMMIPQDVTASPVSLTRVVERASELGIQSPFLIRFPEIIRARVSRFRDSFDQAIHSEGYQGSHRMLYPIKVNPEDGVVRTFLDANRPRPTGLEIGSKAELICAISHLGGLSGDATLVCNGKKDDEFIVIALRASQVGIHTILVSETPGEFSRVLKIAKELGIEPNFGLRPQIVNHAPGSDGDTEGSAHAPFGLTIPELVEEVDFLKSEGRMDNLQLLHFHNSALTRDRHQTKQSIIEISRIYTDLVAEGAALSMLDIGGGVPVVGTSRPGTEYDAHPIDWLPGIVIRTIKEIFDGSGIPHPEIITESGRTILAHSTILIFDIISKGGTPKAVENPNQASESEPLSALAADLARVHDAETHQDVLTASSHNLESLIDEFNSGTIGLRDRAKGERMYHETLRRFAAGQKKFPDDLVSLVADVDFAGLSIFRSMPDVWGLGEVFPTLPIRGLERAPSRSVKIRDLTCDPDGVIDLFWWNGKNSPTLPVCDSDEPIALGTFLLGAYQEILGSSHNLLGTTHLLDVTSKGTGGEFTLNHTVAGDSVSDLLSRINTPPATVLDTFIKALDKALASGKITQHERFSAFEELEESLSAYTYFNAD